MKKIKRLSLNLANTLRGGVHSDSDNELSSSPKDSEDEHLNPVWRYNQTILMDKEKKSRKL